MKLCETPAVTFDLGEPPELDPGELATIQQCRTGSPTQMLCLHNFARRYHGLTELKRNPLLVAAANAKARRMIECKQFSHTPCGDPWMKVLNDAGYRYRRAGENAAWGYPRVRDTFTGWLNSPGHRANILTPEYSEFGSAYVAVAEFRFLWVVDFGEPA